MNENNEPRLVDTGRGFSVSYQNRLLYSRVDPSKNSLLALQRLQIKNETLYLCISPLLGYGLEHFLENLGESSFVLGLEADENLMAFSASRVAPAILENPSFKYIRTSSASRVLETLQALEKGPFRRCVRIDLSGGSSLHSEFYAETVSAVDEYISRYWRNHLTLMKLGRNFARNVFANCALLSLSFEIPSATFTLPVMVAGAGPSLDDSLPFIRAHRNAMHLLALDTALSSLHDAGITPDAVILVESQFWIERAFTGFRNSNIPVYADMTARTNAMRATGGPIHFFFSEYTRCRFIARFLGAGFAPLVVPPLGSVGLVALYLAEKTAAQNTPVLYTGLDFSFGKGFTHSRGSPPVREIQRQSNRFSPAGNEAPQLAPGVFTAKGKQNGPVYSDPSLSGYADLCRGYFGKNKKLFDIGKTGFITAGMPVSETEAARFFETTGTIRQDKSVGKKYSCEPLKIKSFLDGERQNLQELKDILCGNNAPDNLEKKVKALVSEMDYLFLHFPDGYRGYSGEKNFLKRVRIEVEYFLKTLKHCDT